MIRHALTITLIAFAMLPGIVIAQTKLPADVLFTVNVPVKFQAINLNMTDVAVRCELRGYSPADVPPETDPTSVKLPVRTFVTKGAPPNLVLQPLTLYYKGPTLEAPLGAGGYFQGTVPVYFTSSDFALNPAALSDPANVTEIYCQFALRGKDGLLYQPAFDPYLARQEIDSFRFSLREGRAYTGRISLTQPQPAAWPPLLTPYPVVEAKTPYQWHAAWLLPFPAWLQQQ